MIFPYYEMKVSRAVRLRWDGKKWKCMVRDDKLSACFTAVTFYTIVGYGRTPQEAYFDAFPRTRLQKLRKFLRRLL